MRTDPSPPESVIASALHPPGSEDLTSAAARILLVEDDPVDARRVQKDLSEGELDCEITWVRTVGEAVQQLRRGGFAALMADLHLPDSRRLETVRRLRACDAELPMVVFTSSRDDETALASLKAGAQDFIVKDEISPPQLVRTLRLAMARTGSPKNGSPATARSRLRFGDFELDRDDCELRHHGEMIEIKRKPLDLLVYLAERHHRAVSKEELFASVWEDQVVSDTALSTALKQVRKALGDDGQSMRMIRTERGYGYRFMPEVEQVSRDAEDARGARRLGAVGLPSDDGCDPQAAELFLQGNYHLEHLQFSPAIDCYDRGLAIEPAFAPGRTGLVTAALMASMHAERVPAAQLRDRAEMVAEQTLEQFPAVGRAHYAMAMVHLFRWRWESAESGFVRAIELEPDYPWSQLFLANVLAITGRANEALEWGIRAIESAPLQIEIRHFAARNHRYAGARVEALAEMERVTRMEPRFRPSYRTLSEMYLDEGRDADAVGALLRVGGKGAESLWGIFDRDGIDGVLEAVLAGATERLPHVHFERAVLCARLRRAEQAIAHIDQAIEAGERAAAHLACEPALADLRRSGALAGQLARLGLSAA